MVATECVATGADWMAGATIGFADALRGSRCWSAISHFMAGSARRPCTTEVQQHFDSRQRAGKNSRRNRQDQLSLINRPQLGSLDRAHWSGRATGNHQDPATTLLLPRRTAHPLGAPPHFASSPALALGKPVRSRPGTIARLAISCLTAPSAPDPPTKLLNRLEDSRQVAPRVSLTAYRPDNLAQHRHCGPATSSLPGYCTLHTASSIGIKASLSLSLAFHLLSDRHAYIPSVDSG